MSGTQLVQEYGKFYFELFGVQYTEMSEQQFCIPWPSTIGGFRSRKETVNKCDGFSDI